MNDIFTARSKVMNLSQVKTGTKVKIKSFENDEIILKLMEMGCLPEEEITVWKKSPFWRPNIYYGFRLFS